MPRHRMPAPKSLPIRLYLPPHRFNGVQVWRLYWPLQNLYPIQLPAAIRMPFVSKSIVFLNKCPSVLLATSMPEGGQYRLQDSSYIDYSVDFRFVGNVGKIGLRCAAESAPYHLSFAAGMEILLDAVGMILLVNFADNPRPMPKSGCREGGFVRPDHPLPLFLGPMETCLTPGHLLLLILGADIKLLSRNPLLISHLVHSFPDGTRITRVTHLLTDGLRAETPSAGIMVNKSLEAGSLCVIEDWGSAGSFDSREYRPLPNDCKFSRMSSG